MREVPLPRPCRCGDVKGCLHEDSFYCASCGTWRAYRPLPPPCALCCSMHAQLDERGRDADEIGRLRDIIERARQANDNEEPRKGLMNHEVVRSILDEADLNGESTQHAPDLTSRD